MGREARSITVRATVSRHNSPEDDRDDQLMDDLIEAIALVADDPKYIHIQPWIS